MKTKSYLLCTLCVLLQSFNLVNAQVVWLTTKNMDFTNCDREERDVKDFTGVTNSSAFDVIFEQSKEPYVIVEGDEGVFEKLHTVVRRGVLDISMDPARYRNVRLRLKVGSPNIESLTMAGSGSIACTSDIVTDGDFTTRVAGSGDISVKSISCAGFQSTVAGSGDLMITTLEATDASVSVAGSGDWGARNVEADNITLSVAGSGDIDIFNANIKYSVTASVAGSGDISVNGTARDVSARVVGSGDISGRLKYDSIKKVKTGSGDIDW